MLLRLTSRRTTCPTAGLSFQTERLVWQISNAPVAFALMVFVATRSVVRVGRSPLQHPRTTVKPAALPLEQPPMASVPNSPDNRAQWPMGRGFALQARAAGSSRARQVLWTATGLPAMDAK